MQISHQEMVVAQVAKLKMGIIDQALQVPAKLIVEMASELNLNYEMMGLQAGQQDVLQIDQVQSAATAAQEEVLLHPIHELRSVVME